MKIKNIFNISAGVALALGLTACSSDYLDLKPEGTLEYKDVLTNEEGATLAVTGMCNSMYKQYSSIDDGSLGYNGEPEMLQFYGEAQGIDYVSTYWLMYGGPTLLNWYQDRGSSVMNSSSGSQPAWSYCYQLISQANNLLTFTPKELDEQGQEVEQDFGVESPTLEFGYAGTFNPVPDFMKPYDITDESPDDEIRDAEYRAAIYAFRYAQALTIRAHAYIHLMQIYCSRFEQRRTTEGNWSLTVPLRLKYQSPESDLNCPLATWEELMNQIYADLSQALELYEESGMTRTYQWEPDANIAMGLFSRIALINHDWETARQMAHDARVGYPIMTMQEYKEGFAIPNSEWMWTNSGEFQGVYFWSFGALYACNGAYPTRWGSIGAGGINNDLIAQFTRDGFLGSNSAYDQRGSLFFSPRNVLGNMKNEFWKSDNVDGTTMDISKSTNGDLMTEFATKFIPNMYKNVEQYGWIYPYTFYGAPMGYNAYTTSATFGAQFKFWGTDGYSTSHYPFMRASEMLLNEAEALCMLEKYKEADDLLYELNINRYSFDNKGESRYNQTYSGTDVLTALKIFRRMELWGEGFNWFDFKRWNEGFERTSWTEGGNWPQNNAFYFPTTASNGWRFRIPAVEYNYNTAIDRTMASLGYDW